MRYSTRRITTLPKQPPHSRSSSTHTLIRSYGKVTGHRKSKLKISRLYWSLKLPSIRRERIRYAPSPAAIGGGLMRGTKYVDPVVSGRKGPWNLLKGMLYYLRTGIHRMLVRDAKDILQVGNSHPCSF